MNENIVTILDLGTTKTVCLIGQQTPDGKIKIIGYGEEKSAGIHRGLVMNVGEASTVIKSVVAKAQKMSGYIVTEAYVGIAGQHITTQLTSHSVTNKNDREFITAELRDRLISDVNKIALNPGEVVLQVFPQEYYVDNVKVNNPIGTMGIQLKGNFNIAITKQKNIEILSKALEFSNIRIKRLLLEPYASSFAVLTNDEKEAGVCMIDIGGGTTDMIIFKDNIIRHIAVIPLAGQIITSDIQAGLSITSANAEKLKTEYGCAIEAMVKDTDTVTIEGIGGRDNREISLKAIAGIIQARVHEIVDTVLYEIKNAGLYSQLGAGITITGGGAKLKNLVEFITYRTGLDTRVGLPSLTHISSSDDFRNPKYSTAIGLLNKANELEKEFIRANQNIIQQKQQQMIEEENKKYENNEQKKNQKFGKTKGILREIGGLFKDNSKKTDKDI